MAPHICVHHVQYLLSSPGMLLNALVPSVLNLGSHFIKYHTIFLSTVDWTWGEYFFQTGPIRFHSLRFLELKVRKISGLLGRLGNKSCRSSWENVEKQREPTHRERIKWKWHRKEERWQIKEKLIKTLDSLVCIFFTLCYFLGHEICQISIILFDT